MLIQLSLVFWSLLLKRVTKLQGDVRLVGLKPQVLAMFELTRMFRVFQTYSDLQKAIKSFTDNE
jgi:anti-anti-sigma regulatory factor